MNNPITVKIESNIDITDEQKNELREKLVYAFIEQLRKSGMYKVTEEKDGYAWILRADLILPKKHEVEPDNGWISVKDRLPDDNVDVLLHDTYCGTLMGWYDKQDGIFKSDYISRLDAVTRWIPLPEEPKGE